MIIKQTEDARGAYVKPIQTASEAKKLCVCIIHVKYLPFWTWEILFTKCS